MGGEAIQEVSLEIVRELLERQPEQLEKSSPEQRKAMLHLVVSKITLAEGSKIGNIALDFDDKLQKYFMQQDPSANAANGSLLCSGAGKVKFQKFSIAI